MAIRLSAPERRAAILDAAAPIFARDGYETARLDRIAAACGVSKPIIYRHFDSKSGLYMALLERHRTDMPLFFAEAGKSLAQGDSDRAGANPEQAGTPDPESLIRAVLGIWLDYVREHGENWVLLFRDVGGDEQIRAMRTRVSQEARAVISTFLTTQAAAVLPREQIDPTAEFLTSGLAGLALWANDHPAVAKETLMEVALRFCLTAVTPNLGSDPPQGAK